MDKKQFLLLVLSIALLLSACSTVTTSPTPAIPTASAASGVVAGRLVSQDTHSAYANRYVFLAVVSYNKEGQGAFFVDTVHSPTTQSDDKGYFRFVDVMPEDYVLVVGEPAMGSVAITDPNTGNPKIWKVKSGKVIQMGEIPFAFPK